MTIALIISALIIIIIYSVYFWKIIKNDTFAFELEIIKNFAAWVIKNGASSRVKLWLLVLFSVCIEALYYSLAFLTISNTIYQFMTAFFAGVELVHLGRLSYSLRGFFKGKNMISQVFNWRLERISAVLFFTHALITLLVLFI